MKNFNIILMNIILKVSRIFIYINFLEINKKTI